MDHLEFVRFGRCGGGDSRCCAVYRFYSGSYFKWRKIDRKSKGLVRREKKRGWKQGKSRNAAAVPAFERWNAEWGICGRDAAQPDRINAWTKWKRFSTRYLASSSIASSISLSYNTFRTARITGISVSRFLPILFRIRFILLWQYSRRIASWKSERCLV